MNEWLHLLYDAGMNDVDITAMLAMGINRAILLAIQEHDEHLILKLREWASIADKCFYEAMQRVTD